MAGVGGVATVIEGLARAYMDDGKIDADEINDVFNKVDKGAKKQTINMPSSKQWSDPDDNEYTDDEGNTLYYDRTGKLRKFKTSDVEYQQMYHYDESNQYLSTERLIPSSKEILGV